MRQIKFYFLTLLAILGFSSTAFSEESSEYKWVPRYLNSIDGETTADEVIDFLFNVREMIVN